MLYRPLHPTLPQPFAYVTKGRLALSLGALLCLLLLCSCSTAVSTLQPANTLRKGGVHLGAAMDVNIPVSRIYSLVDTANDLQEKYRANTNYSPTEQDRIDALKAAAGLALNAPGASSDFLVRYGALENFDVGLRWSTTAVHGDGKFQFLGKGDGTTWDGAVSLGYSYALYKGFVFDALEILKINDFSRHNVEIPLLFGKRLKEWGYVWMGPKYIASKYHVDGALQNAQLTDKSDGWIHYAGALAGFGAGYKYIYAFVELTAMYMFAQPTILGQKTDIGGVLVAPSVGLMARW